MIWTGTCGFGKRRSDVFRDLQAVEIQQTFYRPFAVESAKRWREAAPEDFVFCVKASQFITHPASSPTYRRSGRNIEPGDAPRYGGFQDSPRVEEGWRNTREIAEAVRAKAILFQCPASFGPSEEHVAALYGFFETHDAHAIRAWEPRGPWATHVVAKICEDLDIAHAVDPFDREPATYGQAYFRLHGHPPGPRMYRYRYTDADLDRLRATCLEYDDAFVLFNNLSMHEDAKRFRALVEPAVRG